MGPKGAFENGNIGTVVRHVPACQVVSAVPERTRCARRPKPPGVPRTPPVVETLRKALEWRRELDAGEVSSQAAIARREGLTRARVTQILILLRLAPEIQERILNVPRSLNPQKLPESVLRPITRIEDFVEQAMAFEDIINNPS